MFAALMNLMRDRQMLPQISDTERQALEAGHVWIDGDIFAGKADFDRLLKTSYHSLSAEEQAFMDGPLEELLNRADSYAIAKARRVPDDIYKFMQDEGFFGLIIPKEYGGKGFSTLARSAVMAKVTGHSTILTTYVVIPNTLGAAELLIEYGTDEQKDHYLPRLAKGEYLPCFGLTEPTAGSDAASIKAEAVTYRGDDGEVMLRMNFRKRYITLAPVANIVSLACRVRDPENLLGKGEDAGISVVLLHKGTPGLQTGDRHEPIGDPFPNGVVIGENVEVPASNIIGGHDRAGEGWKMLMEQLAGGRMVSLPAGAVGGIRAASLTAGAYSMVRQQFGIQIGRMEGVATPVGRLSALAYMTEAARVHGCSAVDDGIDPPVVSGALKAYTTDLAQKCSVEAMDVCAGAGVMQGPNNILGRGYSAAPVGVTVEGANIMTRTLIIFGQGATRCHPYALKVVKAVEDADVGAFRSNLLGWLGAFFVGMGRNAFHSLTRGLFVKTPNADRASKTYYRRLGWAIARFGFMTNLALFFVGGKLKVKGNLTGRYADVLSWTLMGLSTLRRYEAEGRRAEDLPLVHYSLQLALANAQQAFEGIYQNFGGPLGAVLKTVGMVGLRVNPLARMPSDNLAREAAAIAQKWDAQSERLAADLFLPRDSSTGLGRLLDAFRKVCAAEPLVAKVKAAQKAGKLGAGDADALAEKARKAGVLTEAEAAQLAEAREARLAAIEVDVFTPEEFFANASSTESAETREAA